MPSPYDLYAVPWLPPPGQNAGGSPDSVITVRDSPGDNATTHAVQTMPENLRAGRMPSPYDSYTGPQPTTPNSAVSRDADKNKTPVGSPMNGATTHAAQTKNGFSRAGPISSLQYPYPHLW
jgi:hypothetical protein